MDPKELNQSHYRFEARDFHSLRKTRRNNAWQTMPYSQEAAYDPCLSGAVPHVSTRLVSGDVICTFGQFSYHMDCLLLPV